MRLARIGLGSSDVRRGWRDPWFLAALLAPLLLLPLLLGDPIGEPVADDYDYLHHVLFTKSWSWFDGGGAHLFWRPLGRQVYYATFAPWMLSHPRTVALLQLGCLSLAAALLYRAFARALGAPAAFAVSTGPWMMESSRLLVAWPACFQDTGALLFLSLAIHEAAAARLVTFLAAGLAALLCKEVAGVALVSILVCPVVHFSSSKERRGWIVSTGVLVAAWAALYTWIHFRASLQFPVPVTALSGPEWARALWLVPWWSFKGICAAPGERSAQTRGGREPEVAIPGRVSPGRPGGIRVPRIRHREARLRPRKPAIQGTALRGSSLAPDGSPRDPSRGRAESPHAGRSRGEPGAPSVTADPRAVRGTRS